MRTRKTFMWMLIRSQRLLLHNLIVKTISLNIKIFLWIFPSRPGPNPLPHHCHLHLLVGGRRHLRLPGGGQQWEGLQGETLGLPDAAHNWLSTHSDISGTRTHSRQPYQEVQNLRQRLQGFMKYFRGQKIQIPCLLMRFHLKVIEVLMEERKPHKSGPQVKQKISEI